MATERQQSPPANGALKRRQSDLSEAPEQDTKRLRTSPGKTSPDPEATTPANTDRARRESTDKPSEPRDARRKSSAVNEKDRSRRLFGGLLGSLSQKGDSRTAKRRQEIESRKKAELQQQDDQNLEDKQKRLEQLAEKRRRVKKRVDEETMRNRHRNMLHSAHFLHTSAQPRLLYKPWELLSDEEDRIDDQIYEAKLQIERELADAEKASATKTETGDAESPERTTNDPTNDGHLTKEDSTMTEPAQKSQTETAGDSTADTVVHGRDETSMSKDEGEHADKPASPGNNGKLHDQEAEDSAQNTATPQQEEHDDHVVEGEEDTVIY